MKKLAIKVLITVILMFTIVNVLDAQFLNGFYNGTMPIQHTLIPQTDPFRGYLIPNTTEWDGPNPSPTSAYFPILVVFVQFADDVYDAPHGSWPLGQAPIYMDSMIATLKNTNSSTPWWEKYNPETQMISSQWMEISRGKFHVISPGVDGKGAFFVQLDSAYKYADPNTGENYMNQVIWQKLWEQGLRDWTPYDQWSFNPTDGLFYNVPDSTVDFIYKIHRSRNRGAMPDNDGYAALSSRGGTGLVDTVNNIIADYGLSGFTLSFRGLESQYIAAAGHEHVHFMTVMKHIQNSRIAYGIGLDFFFSPYDMILNEYMTPRTATFGATNTLGDFSSRNNNLEGEILKVPINNSTGECFLLANRRKVSKWDRIMLGDSAQIEPYKDNSELGKGLYIYHLKNEVHFPESINDTVQDLECADGYWKWKLVSTGGVAKLPYDCYTSGQAWHVFQKDSVLYSNDPSTLGELRPPYYNSNYGNPLPYGDDISFFHRLNDTTWTNRWTTGKFTNQNCGLNVERTFTNDIDIIDNGNLAGDRWDAWKPGYNEMFSPYSSPSTKKWNNEESGIFIYFDSLSGNSANIKIYKIGENGMTEAQILVATPPSRPMGLKLDVTECIDSKVYPILTWHHNMEPDMLQPPRNIMKRYKIYRAYDEVNSVPSNYTEIADVTIDKDVTPTYIDYDTYGNCYPTLEDVFRIRYKIKAVDTTGWASVYSDFVAISTQDLNRGGGDNMVLNSNVPVVYSLSQNYPNPFNPMTKINFALPRQGFVTLKIYDITGREIQTLVNEVKQSGYYTVDFNGSSLSSGVYFYRIQSNNFVSVKRMVLIK